MEFSEGDVVNITIDGVGVDTYITDGEFGVVTADVTEVPSSDDVDVFVKLWEELGGLREGRIDVDGITVEYEDGRIVDEDVLTMFDSETGEGPHWAGVVTNIDQIQTE